MTDAIRITQATTRTTHTTRGWVTQATTRITRGWVVRATTRITRGWVVQATTRITRGWVVRDIARTGRGSVDASFVGPSDRSPVRSDRDHHVADTYQRRKFHDAAAPGWQHFFVL